jgi:transposase
LYQHLDSRQTHWSTSDVRTHIEETFGVLYSHRHVQRLLQRMGLFLGKPFALDQRRAHDAEEQLRSRLRAACQQLQLNGIKPHQVALGLADEAAPQTRANRVPLWSTRHQTLRDTTTKLRSSTFGFYALRGRSIVAALENSKGPSFIDMLTRIKAAHQRYKAIIVIWDNLPSHKTEAVRAHAAALGIVLVNVPPYAPDLNPIEYIWKSVRRAVAQERVLQNQEHLRGIIDRTFIALSASMSFARSWKKKLFTPLFTKKATFQPDFVL